MNRIAILLLMVLVPILCSKKGVSNEKAKTKDDNENKIIPFGIDEEYIRHIHSMIHAYRDDVLGERFIIETNALIDTRFKTLKRNADLINSLLALPKGLNDAGR